MLGPPVGKHEGLINSKWNVWVSCVSCIYYFRFRDVFYKMVLISNFNKVVFGANSQMKVGHRVGQG